MSDIAIRVRGLSKRYALRNPKVMEYGSSTHETWALKAVDFTVKKGDSVGIVGPNGSGKSTLLKILSGVTKPTSGTAEIEGKIASILDIGAGFHPELSGRENIFLNGQIHGFSKQYIQTRFDEIVKFSGIEKFIEEPVKNYSNGMYLRLAFSIMAHLDFDVYLFDEVFSVGDAEFAVKTKIKFDELMKSGSTLMFASHNISELIKHGNYIVLDSGEVKSDLSSNTLLADYFETMLGSAGVSVFRKNFSVSSFSGNSKSDEIAVAEIRCHQTDCEETGFTTDRSISIEVQYAKLKAECTIDMVMEVQDAAGNTLAISAAFVSGDFNLENKMGNYTTTCIIPGFFLNAQVYRISLFFYRNLSISLGNKEIQSKEDVDDLVRKGVVGLAHSMEQVISFKPTLRIPENDFDPTVIINTQVGFLPGFKWVTKESVR